MVSLHKLLHTLPIAETHSNTWIIHYIQTSASLSLINIHMFSGRGLPAEEALQVSCDPLAFPLVSDQTFELSQEAVYHLETHTPPHIHHPEHKEVQSCSKSR